MFASFLFHEETQARDSYFTNVEFLIVVLDVGVHSRFFLGLQVAQSGDTKGFEWTRQWYPVAVVRDLEAMDPRQPYPVKVQEKAHC